MGLALVLPVVTDGLNANLGGSTCFEELILCLTPQTISEAELESVHLLSGVF